MARLGGISISSEVEIRLCDDHDHRFLVRVSTLRTTMWHDKMQNQSSIKLFIATQIVCVLFLLQLHRVARYQSCRHDLQGKRTSKCYHINVEPPLNLPVTLLVHVDMAIKERLSESSNNTVRNAVISHSSK